MRGGPGAEVGARVPKFDVWVALTLRILGRGHRSLVNFWVVTRLKTVRVDSHVYRQKVRFRASEVRGQRKYNYHENHHLDPVDLLPAVRYGV